MYGSECDVSIVQLWDTMIGRRTEEDALRGIRIWRYQPLKDHVDDEDRRRRRNSVSTEWVQAVSAPCVHIPICLHLLLLLRLSNVPSISSREAIRKDPPIQPGPSSPLLLSRYLPFYSSVPLYPRMSSSLHPLSYCVIPDVTRPSPFWCF